MIASKCVTYIDPVKARRGKRFIGDTKILCRPYPTIVVGFVCKVLAPRGYHKCITDLPPQTRIENSKAVCGSSLSRQWNAPTQRKIYSKKDDAKTEIFNFIEMFYNPIKRHSYTGGVCPAQFEEDDFSRLESV